MTINRHNYEMFLIDYLDGKLTTIQVDELMVFLKNNPEIQAEFEGIQDAVLALETVTFPNKSYLKKKKFQDSGIDNELDYLCIASIEGELTEAETINFNNRMSASSENKLLIEKYIKTKLNPDTNIHFSNKSQLKRISFINLKYATVKYVSSIAAGLFIVFAGYSLIRMVNQKSVDNNIYQNQFASIQPQNANPKTEKPLVKKEHAKETKKTVKINKQHFASQTKEQETISKLTAPELISPKLAIAIQPSSIKSTETIVLPKYYTTYASTNLTQLNDDQPIETPKSNTKVIGVFEIAQMGLRSFGKLIGRDIQLDAKRNSKGKIKEVRFESTFLAFSAPISKNEE